MNWIDTGYLLSKNKYNENSIIAEIFTENHGKCSGIIFGASSKKIKNYLEIGNKLHLNNTSKNENRIGSFKVEILKAFSPLYFDDKKKLLCITSALNLVKLLTVDSQKNIKIFELIDKFYSILSNKEWIKDYIFWELEFLKLIGYDLELFNRVDKETNNKQIRYYVTSSHEKKLVPNFLVDKDHYINDYTELLNGLKLVGDYMDKSILHPNNINHPRSRLDFINVLK